MNDEEQNRFSLRKLSVGLASVLIGVGIFSTSQTVKADTLTDNSANQKASSVISNAQSSDTTKNKNAVKSSFSSDNQANNVKNNLIQTQEANDSNNLQEKDAESAIVRTSSLQKTNNQSNQANELTVQATQQTQDISTISDPSEIDASHFVDGTRWTLAGWTRIDKNTIITDFFYYNVFIKCKE